MTIWGLFLARVVQDKVIFPVFNDYLLELFLLKSEEGKKSFFKKLLRYHANEMDI